jgi:hypothetical protein
MATGLSEAGKALLLASLLAKDGLISQNGKYFIGFYAQYTYLTSL